MFRKASNDYEFQTGYKFFDDPLFGKSTKYKKQPDYNIVPLWPLYQYYMDNNSISAVESQLDILIDNYFNKKCIDGTNCLYNLKNYFQMYLVVDEDGKHFIDIVDRTKGFIPLHMYEKSVRTYHGNPNKPRGNAFYYSMVKINRYRREVIDAFQLYKNNWDSLQCVLQKMLNQNVA